MSAIFEVDGGLAGRSALFDLWSSPAELAFDAVTAPAGGAGIVTWRANLSGGAASRAQLAGGEKKIQAVRAALSLAEQRLPLLAAGSFAGASPGEAMPFDLAPAPLLIGPLEQALWEDLRAARAATAGAQAAPTADGLLDFAPRRGGDTARWNEAAQALRGELRRLQQQLSHFAWIETREAELLLGRTGVHWDGDFVVFWRQGVLPAQQYLHQRQVTLAVQSRRALVAMFSLTLSFAGRLALAAALPGGLLHALPLVWRYVQQMTALYSQRAGSL